MALGFESSGVSRSVANSSLMLAAPTFYTYSAARQGPHHSNGWLSAPDQGLVKGDLAPAVGLGQR